MSAPTVACVMLANGRPEMVARALKSYRAQTYPDRVLIQYDNDGQQSIGALRNDANSRTKCDIICHFDSDDWSHPNRIAEQVALLQSSGAECVGYHEMLFWRSVDEKIKAQYAEVLKRFPSDAPIPKHLQLRGDEAWLYRAAIPNYAIGTSMCYWRETWERHPFPDRSEGCDDLDWFNRGVKICSESTIVAGSLHCDECQAGYPPRMIASIHGGNTCAKIDARQREWTRVPEWDGYCREAMRL
jgi:cellulose synthase/poly-beta-1,6-N-acetylglucosamine synthase-like glycosyltransferase